MGLFDVSRRLRNDVDELFSRIERLKGQLERLETEWGDTKDQLRRSYQRLEKAAQRHEKRRPPPPLSEKEQKAAEKKLDPFSRKVRQIRRQGALLQRDDETTG